MNLARIPREVPLVWTDSKNWHYAANVFPLMEPDEISALSEDIKINGLLNPIIRCSGKILDGRNRALACFAASVEPKFRDISEKQAEAWARSQNVYRRFLKPEQQAFALVALSQSKLTETVGKKRLKAYHKLKILKEAILPLIEKAKNGIDVSKELTQLLRAKKKAPIEKSIFTVLEEKLHLFEPSWADGEEHAFIKQIEQAMKTSLGDDTQKHQRESLALTLERLSKSFLIYSEKLRVVAS
jgi:hypothetical protein